MEIAVVVIQEMEANLAAEPVTTVYVVGETVEWEAMHVRAGDWVLAEQAHARTDETTKINTDPGYCIFDVELKLSNWTEQNETCGNSAHIWTWPVWRLEAIWNQIPSRSANRNSIIKIHDSQS